MTDKALLLHWLAACSGPLLAAGAAQAQQAAPAQRPNILFILTDDQRWDAVGYVNPIVRTPHIDSLAREGVCFRNAFVTTPISAASRASLLLTEPSPFTSPGSSGVGPGSGSGSAGAIRVA